MHCTKSNKSFYKIKDSKQCMLKFKWKKRTIKLNRKILHTTFPRSSTSISSTNFNDWYIAKLKLQFMELVNTLFT